VNVGKGLGDLFADIDNELMYVGLKILIREALARTTTPSISVSSLSRVSNKNSY
jgi:hypothetical protein